MEINTASISAAITFAIATQGHLDNVVAAICHANIIIDNMPEGVIQSATRQGSLVGLEINSRVRLHFFN